MEYRPISCFCITQFTLTSPLPALLQLGHHLQCNFHKGRCDVALQATGRYWKVPKNRQCQLSYHFVNVSSYSRSQAISWFVQKCCSECNDLRSVFGLNISMPLGKRMTRRNIRAVVITRSWGLRFLGKIKPKSTINYLHNFSITHTQYHMFRIIIYQGQAGPFWRQVCFCFQGYFFIHEIGRESYNENLVTTYWLDLLTSFQLRWSTKSQRKHTVEGATPFRNLHPSHRQPEVGHLVSLFSSLPSWSSSWPGVGPRFRSFKGLLRPGISLYQSANIYHQSASIGDRTKDHIYGSTWEVRGIFSSRNWKRWPKMKKIADPPSHKQPNRTWTESNVWRLLLKCLGKMACKMPTWTTFPRKPTIKSWSWALFLFFSTFLKAWLQRRLVLLHNLEKSGLSDVQQIGCTCRLKIQQAFWGVRVIGGYESLLKNMLKRSTSCSLGSFIWHLLPSNCSVKHKLKFHIIDMLKNIRQLAARMDNLQALLALLSVVQLTKCVYFLGMTKCVNMFDSKLCQAYLSIIAFQKALQSVQGPILVKEGLGGLGVTAGIHSQWSQIKDQRLVHVLTSKG